MNITWRKIYCKLFGHSDLMISAINEKKGTVIFTCQDCLESWSEYEQTGREHDNTLARKCGRLFRGNRS